jgi:hypothetical protein
MAQTPVQMTRTNLTRRIEMDEAKKIVRPVECPECHSINIVAFMPSSAFSVFHLTDGEWQSMHQLLTA